MATPMMVRPVFRPRAHISTKFTTVPSGPITRYRRPLLVHPVLRYARKIRTSTKFLAVPRGPFLFDNVRACGRHLIVNNAVEGYVVYVGYGEMPDFTTPAGFGTTLPVSFAITPPPPTETVELWVVTRKRNKYGLESQNTHPQRINIDENGNAILGVLSPPMILGIISIEDEYFRIFGTYPGLETDTDPADIWKLYVSIYIMPEPGVDTPVATGPIIGPQTSVDVGPYPTDDVPYNFALTVFRTVDGEESVAATGTFVMPVDPGKPPALPGAFVVE